MDGQLTEQQREHFINHTKAVVALHVQVQRDRVALGLLRRAGPTDCIRVDVDGPDILVASLPDELRRRVIDAVESQLRSRQAKLTELQTTVLQ